MTDAALKWDTRDIVVEEDFPHSPQVIWNALTSGELVARWLGMNPVGLRPVVGASFTYKTTPAGAWDGLIRCEVLEVVPNERFVYAWKGGHEGNTGYGSPLDTVVAFSLTRIAKGTRVRLVHSGFVLPKNDTAFKNMGEGWKKILGRVGAVADEP